MNTAASVLVLAAIVAPACRSQVEPVGTAAHMTRAGGRLTLSDVPHLREWITPRPEDSVWEQIPWVPAFGAGLDVAREQDLPVLLWVMNGHPLGCT